MSLVQWVNLEKEDIYANDSDIGKKERCGKLTVDVLFEKDKVPLSFKMRVTPVGSDNVTYTQGEERRNSKFKLTQGAVGLADATHVLMEDTIQLPAAGGNKYKIEAQDANGVTVSSLEVETKRKLYYQVLAMDDTSGSVPAYSLAPMEAHSLKHFIVLQKTGTAGKIPYRKTITMHSGGNISAFGSDVGSAYNIDAKLKDVGIAAVFSDYISDMAPHNFSASTPIGTSTPGIVITASDITIVGDQFLWHGLDDNDDNAKTWFISGEVQFTDPTTAVTQTYAIQRSNVSIAGTKYFTHGGYHQIKINRDHGLNALMNKTAGVLAFSLDVNIAAGWTNGFSWSPGGADLITCAKRVLWDDMPTNTQEYTWNHEVGHRFGMVAYGHRRGIAGYNKLPNGPSTLYGENRGINDKDHAGPHCEKGATYSITGGWAGVPGCVMFGANGINSSHSPKEYCSECEPIVRKLDLS